MSLDPILIDLPEQIRGDRVTLRPYRAGDGRAVFEAIDSSRQHLLPWLPWGPFHENPTDTELQVRKWRARWDLREDLAIGIWHSETGEYLGGTGLHRIDWHVRSFEVGYWIRKSAEGHGFITDTVQLLTKFAFDHLTANRVFIRCAKENVRSAAVPVRLGFPEEGLLRHSIMDADGVLRDIRLFAMTRDDYEANARFSSSNSGS